MHKQSFWIGTILLLGIGECILLFMMYMIEPTANATGLAHPSIPSMAIGGDSSRYAPISNLAFIFQTLVIAQAHALFALGVKESRRDLPFNIALFVCFVCGWIVWWQMHTEYEAYLLSGDPKYIFGFPEATAWQVYGIWGAGLSLVALYAIGFKRYVWSEADEAKFKALIANQTNEGQ